LLKTNLDPKCAYKPIRFQMLNMVDMERISPHSMSFVLTKEMFWKAKGFDETFTGYWNGASILFRRSLKRVAQITELNNVRLLRFENDVIPDASVVEWSREGGEFDIKNNPQMYRKQKQALGNPYKPKERLKFTWQKVM
jgi:hypothetical protein